VKPALRLVAKAPTLVDPALNFGVDHKALRVPNYQTGAACPGCGWTNWEVRNLTASCAKCGTVLSL
jgi:hypothetical protein